MKKIILFLIIAISDHVYSQNQKLISIFNEARSYINANSASFNDKLRNKNNKFKYHVNATNNILKYAQTEKDILGVISYYLSYADDNHQDVYAIDNYFPFKSLQDTLNVEKFFKENVESVAIKKSSDSTGLLGKWYYPKENMWINIQENSDKERAYVGAIINTNKIYAKEGFVKIEFYKNHKNETVATIWDLLYRYPETRKIKLDGAKLIIGNRILYRNQNQYDPFKNTTTSFAELNGKTNLITVNDFDYANKKIIDSLLNTNKSQINSKEHLIIDLRGNTGGADLSYYEFIPQIMSNRKNFFPISHALFLSENNIKNYANIFRNRGEIAKADSIQLDYSKKINSFQKDVAFREFDLTEIPENPKNIFIIVDEKNASATEGFILLAKQSAKVKIAGTNTSGTLNYGNVNNYKLENANLKLSITQSKVQFKENAVKEFMGIIPDIDLSNYPKKDWIESLVNKYIK